MACIAVQMNELDPYVLMLCVSLGLNSRKRTKAVSPFACGP